MLALCLVRRSLTSHSCRSDVSCEFDRVDGLLHSGAATQPCSVYVGSFRQKMLTSELFIQMGLRIEIGCPISCQSGAVLVTHAPKTFGQRLRILRESRGLSVRGLAGRIGVSSVTVWKWEKGEASPRQRSLAALADALGVTSVELRSWEATRRLKKAMTTSSDVAEIGSSSRGVLSPASVQSSIEIADTITKAKQMIAGASGTSAANVTIRIAY